MATYADMVSYAKDLLATNCYSDLLAEIESGDFVINEEREFCSWMLRISRDPKPHEFDFLEAVTARVIRGRQQMPAWLWDFAADCLDGKRQRPSERGRPNKFWDSATLACAAVSVANNFKVPMYLNSENAAGASAAEVVADAARGGVTTDVVAKAIKNMKAYNLSHQDKRPTAEEAKRWGRPNP